LSSQKKQSAIWVGLYFFGVGEKGLGILHFLVVQKWVRDLLAARLGSMTRRPEDMWFGTLSMSVKGIS
jgi:hypothetical protein